MLTRKQIQYYKFDICQFVDDLVYIQSKLGPQKVRLWPYQREILTEATKRIPINDETWDNKYSTVCISMPKRNSKTFLASLILAWKSTMFRNIHGVVASNSKDQASSVVFDQFKEILLTSPELLDIVGSENILDKEVRIPQLQTKIVVLSSSKASAWGYGIDIGIVDEIHAAPDDEGLFQILASQTGDRNGQVILPSQVSSMQNILRKLYDIHLEEKDPHLYFKYIADENPSPLITESWLASRKASLTPLQYDLYHRNLWISSSRRLFIDEDIGECVNLGSDIEIPVSPDKLHRLAERLNSSYKIGGGLDRAFPWSKHGDGTVWTTVAKLFHEDEELYLILNQVNFPSSDGKQIRKAIKEDHERYNFDKIKLEVYQAADIHQWALDNYINSEIVHATDRAQIPAFTNLHQVISRHRLFIPSNLPSIKDPNSNIYIPILVNEMKTFEEDDCHNVPKFGHKPGTKFKDDSIYSLVWAIDALQEEEVYVTVKKRRNNTSLNRDKNKYTGN